MGSMKAILIDRLDDDEVFRLAFELEEDTRLEPELPDLAESFTDASSIHQHLHHHRRRHHHARH